MLVDVSGTMSTPAGGSTMDPNASTTDPNGSPQPTPGGSTDDDDDDDSLNIGLHN